MKILFAGGGTGGHLFPALAIAQEVERLAPECRIEFVGTRYGLEAKMKETIGYPLSMICMRGLPRKLSLGLLWFPVRLLWSVMQSLLICRRFRPDVVVGTGGYVSGPVIIAAALKRIPRVLQEQNSYPGLVTRQLASRTNILFIAYRRALEFLPRQVNYRFAGNPVRRSITQGNRTRALEKFGLSADRRTILILGGSQGARRLNDAVLSSLEYLDDSVQLLWQCGKRDYKEVAERLDKKDFVISLFPFSNEMELVYAAADIAVCRAGALTIAELTACAIPALLIPFPQATADHQTYNAAEMTGGGAAEMIPDAELNNVKLLQRAVAIVHSERLSVMKEAARKFGRPNAAAEIAGEIIHLVGKRGTLVKQQPRGGAA